MTFHRPFARHAFSAAVFALLVATVRGQFFASPAPIPSPALPLTDPAARAGMVEIPFDFSQGVIILDIDYGGSRPAKVALDTGDADSLLDVDVARAIGLPLEMKDMKAAGSGESAVTFFKIDPSRAELGAAKFPAKDLIVMPVSKTLLADAGFNAEGTLGYEFFKDRVVQIDYPARMLRLYDAAPKGNPRATSEGADLPIQWRQYHSASAQLVTTDQLHLGDKTIVAQIDTCFGHGMILFMTKVPWVETFPRSDVGAVHYEEATLQPARIAPAVALGNLHFKVNPNVFLARADAHVPETDIAAVLGNRFFENGVLTLDFRTSRLAAEWSAPFPGK